MEKLEIAVQECVDFVFPVIQNLAATTDELLEHPLPEDSFSADLLEFRWPALQNDRNQNIDTDAIVGLALRRVLIDSSPLEGESDQPSNKDSLYKIAVVLDFCYHSRKNRKNPLTWSIAFFALFSSVIDSLSWPRGLLEFWPYAESRIEWFKMCNSLDPLRPGSSNLISYKQPLYDKLRHWNDLLKAVKNNYYLNTPACYEMKFKFEKFLSELLPLYEESNFNRSALFSNKQSSGNPWNKTISSSTRTESSSENIFATDYNYVFDELLTAPLEFIYKPLEFKIDMDKVLTPLLDAIFEVEEDFYRGIKKSHKMVSSINEKLNHAFPVDFEILQTRVPNYMKISKRNNEERQKYWTEFLNLNKLLSSAVQPTLLDISVSNPCVIYDQMLELDNDYHRKQFILQICFTANLIRQIITSPDVENYYKNCYQKERPAQSINFQSLNESNHKKTLSLCDYLVNNRTKKFYQHRDPQFVLVIEKLLESEDCFLKAKVDGFKSFQSFNISDEQVKLDDTDYSYKKFGFILLGNKSLNNVWKVKTGLDVIPEASKNAKEIFEDLNSKRNHVNMDQEDLEASDDRIVKDWQILRSLRSQYLFSFNKIDEHSGLDGLFESSLSDSRLSERRKLLERLVEKVKEPHLLKLQSAREFMTDRKSKKRSLEEEKENEVVKKLRPGEEESDHGSFNATSPTEFPVTAESKENETTSSSQVQIEETTQTDENTANISTPAAADAEKTTIGREIAEGNSAVTDQKSQNSTETTVGNSSEHYQQQTLLTD